MPFVCWRLLIGELDIEFNVGMTGGDEDDDDDDEEDEDDDDDEEDDDDDDDEDKDEGVDELITLIFELPFKLVDEFVAFKAANSAMFSLFFAFNSLATLAFCFLDILPNFTAI